MSSNLPTAERVRDLLDYNPKTGLFTHKKPHARACSNPHAGALRSDGYVVINVDWRAFRAHRLAWLYVYGEWPADHIDHINRDRSDNRISNLRLATKAQNMANTITRAGREITGVMWVPHAKAWMARIGVEGGSRFLGYYKREEEAKQAYAHERRRLFPEFAP